MTATSKLGFNVLQVMEPCLRPARIYDAPSTTTRIYAMWIYWADVAIALS
jgi:hypothetical protein